MTLKASCNSFRLYFIDHWPDFVQLFILIVLVFTVKESLKQTELTRDALRTSHVPFLRIHGLKIVEVDPEKNRGAVGGVKMVVTNESDTVAINIHYKGSEKNPVTLLGNKEYVDLGGTSEPSSLMPHGEDIVYCIGFKKDAYDTLIKGGAILTLCITFDDLFGHSYSEDITLQSIKGNSPDTTSDFKIIRTEVSGHFLDFGKTRM